MRHVHKKHGGCWPSFKQSKDALRRGGKKESLHSNKVFHRKLGPTLLNFPATKYGFDFFGFLVNNITKLMISWTDFGCHKISYGFKTSFLNIYCQVDLVRLILPRLTLGLNKVDVKASFVTNDDSLLAF